MNVQKKKRKKKKWSRGSLFKVPLLDGSYVIGLVLEITPQALNSLVCAFYNCRTSPDTEFSISDIDLHNPDIVQFVTRDLLDSGKWLVIKDGVTNVKVKKYMNLAKIESNDWVGVKIIGSGNIVDVFNILHNLMPNDFAIPGYVESLLYKNSQDYFRELYIISDIGKGRITIKRMAYLIIYSFTIFFILCCLYVVVSQFH
jgi:hypothetical protein